MAMEKGSDWPEQRRQIDGGSWYVRRGQRVHGPYPAREIGRYMLLGRILPTDRISDDGDRWRPLVEVHDLIPDEVRHLHRDDGWDRFVEARNRVDERGQGEGLDEPEAERRRLDDELNQLRLRDLWTIALGADPDSPIDPSGEKPAVRRGADLFTTTILLATLIVVVVLLASL